MSQRHSTWLKGKELGQSFYGEEDPTISREEKSRKKFASEEIFFKAT